MGKNRLISFKPSVKVLCDWTHLYFNLTAAFSDNHWPQHDQTGLWTKPQCDETWPMVPVTESVFFKISECVIAHHEDILSSALLCCVRITVYYIIPLHGRVLSFLYLIYVMSPLVAKKKKLKKKLGNDLFKECKWFAACRDLTSATLDKDH